MPVHASRPFPARRLWQATLCNPSADRKLLCKREHPPLHKPLVPAEVHTRLQTCPAASAAPGASAPTLTSAAPRAAALCRTPGSLRGASVRSSTPPTHTSRDAKGLSH